MKVKSILVGDYQLGRVGGPRPKFRRANISVAATLLVYTLDGDRVLEGRSAMIWKPGGFCKRLS